jgi:sigma-B regulation protein RsbU (phosphoserine phosphatase)
MPLSFCQIVRNKINALLIRRTTLWKDIQRFAGWLESEATSAAKEANQSTIVIELGPDGLVETMRIGLKKYPHEFNIYQRLWSFLGAFDIRRVKLDARLEKNQVEDVFVLLYSHRRELAKRRAGRTSRGVTRALLSRQGVLVACTRSSIQDKTLLISYSYCTLRFSRIVRWFEQGHKAFPDHRALFRAAPRYALLIGAVTTCPGIILTYIYKDWFLLTILAVATPILIGLIYLFFMVVGSVEYDNEEKEYNLIKAYEKLKIYTDRIQADIHRARMVQERFLPDLSSMPLSEQLDWAGSFVPAQQVGGDYFDVRTLDDNRVAILFSDVSGHGMAAAFITAILKTTFQAWVDNKSTLPELVDQLNSNLCRLTPEESFAAVFMAIYNASTGEFHYVNAGHQPEPWRIPDNNEKPISALSDARTLIIGVEENITIVTSRQTLKPEDIILFVSDGVVENQNADGEQYGTDRFEKFLDAKRQRPVRDLVKLIVNETEAFPKGAEQSDDRTILAFQIKP